MKLNEKRVRDAVIEIWSTERAPTQRNVAAATKADQQDALTQPAVRFWWRRWEEAGCMRSQIGTNGVSGAAYWFSWGAPESATLCDAVAWALTGRALSGHQKRALRSALRILFGLPRRCPDEAILRASADVPADQLYKVAERVYLESLLKSGNKDTAINYRGAVRGALRGAAMEGLVPVVFPRIWEDDEWEVAKWTYFTDPRGDLQSSTISTYRCNWQRFGEEAKELFGLEIKPEEITAEQLSQLQRHLITRKGQRYLARQIQTILSYIGREFGEGPLVGKWREGVKRGYNGRVNAGYLVDAQGRAASDGNWDVFLGILHDSGLTHAVTVPGGSNGAKQVEEWREFFAWYQDYSTLADDEIEDDDRFPLRPDPRVLEPRTLVKRIIAVRAWGFQAIRLLRETEGLRPEEITLAHAFGSHGPKIARRLRAWWAERAARDEVTDKTSAGLVDILKAGGMIARALYDRSRHTRGLETTGDDGKARKAIDEESLAKTPEEEAYWATYIACRNLMDALETRRRKSSNGHVNTTAKDIRRIIRQTPPSYWAAIQDELMRRVREAKDTGTDAGARYHRLVMLTFLLGLMISCGMRISETTHIRIGQDTRGRDRQYGPGNRRHRLIQLRPGDRKNARRHGAYLRERYCPVWLEQEYLEQSRPFFLQRGDAPDHDWLLVDMQGMPYGCIEEDEDGEGRNDIEHASRIAILREYWIDQLMGIAASLGKEIPTEQGEFAPHVIRNVFGYLLFQRSPKDAANYLGDRLDSVEETYASCDGVHVDVSEAMIDGLGLIKGEVQDDAVPTSAVPIGGIGMSQELVLLMQARNEGHIDDAMFARAIADLHRRYAA